MIVWSSMFFFGRKPLILTYLLVQMFEKVAEVKVLKGWVSLECPLREGGEK